MSRERYPLLCEGSLVEIILIFILIHTQMHIFCSPCTVAYFVKYHLKIGLAFRSSRSHDHTTLSFFQLQKAEDFFKFHNFFVGKMTSFRGILGQS